MNTHARAQKASRTRWANKLAETRMTAQRAEAQKALNDNRCPDCGAGVHVNLALTAWVQCDRSGSGHFRKDPTGATCNWQGFTR